jgi:UPF0716 family protein affecting phage T7 exclusion
MKLRADQVEKLKFIGGAIIVLAAMAIMFPGFVTVALGLWRIFLVALIAGSVCLALAYATRHFSKLKQASLQKGADSNSESPAN